MSLSQNVVALQPRASRLRRWRRILLSFLAGQSAIQIINVLTGFFLLRWLSVTEYAQFGVAFAFQTTLAQLVDLGFSGSIVALSGDRGRDPKVVGSYIRAAQHFRTRMFVVMLVVAVIAFPLVTQRQPWGVTTKILLLGAILASLFVQGWGMYSAPLLIHQRMRQFYAPQLIGASGRLGLSLAFHAVGALSAWITAWIAALTVGFNGLIYRKEARPLIALSAHSDPRYNREMIRYLAPLIPGIAFAAFQGQIALGIITVFGRTRSIAEVAALGRLGQLFMILGAFNAVIVEPYIAGVPRERLARRYFQILGGAVLLAAVLCAFGFLMPGPLLWLLGPKYQNLRQEVGWVVAAACVSYVSGVMWTMHAARKWVFWWGTALYISLLLVTQISCVLLLDLRRTLDVVYFGLITALAILIVHMATAFYGFVFNPRIEGGAHHGVPAEKPAPLSSL